MDCDGVEQGTAHETSRYSVNNNIVAKPLPNVVFIQYL
jgi:hypothetical protein